MDSADLVRTLTVYSVRRESSVGRYHTDIHHTWSCIPIPWPFHLVRPAHTWSKKVEKQLHIHENINHIVYRKLCIYYYREVVLLTRGEIDIINPLGVNHPQYFTYPYYLVSQCLIHAQCQDYYLIISIGVGST